MVSSVGAVPGPALYGGREAPHQDKEGKDDHLGASDADEEKPDEECQVLSAVEVAEAPPLPNVDHSVNGWKGTRRMHVHEKS